MGTSPVSSKSVLYTIIDTADIDPIYPVVQMFVAKRRHGLGY